MPEQAIKNFDPFWRLTKAKRHFSAAIEGIMEVRRDLIARNLRHADRMQVADKYRQSSAR